MPEDEIILTTGQIAEYGLFLTLRGSPIYNKGSVSRIMKGLVCSKVQTPHGEAKTLTASQIDEYNNRYKLARLDKFFHNPETSDNPLIP